MHKTLLRILILFPFITFAQESETFNQSCPWYYKASKTQDRDELLTLVKENFREFESYDEDDPCHILFLLYVNQSYFVLASDSAIFYRYPDLMIQTARVEEINTIRIFTKKAVEALYGKEVKGVVYIHSSSEAYEKRIHDLWKEEH